MKDWQGRARTLTEKMRKGFLVIEELISVLDLTAQASGVLQKLNAAPADRLLLICYNPATRHERYAIQPHNAVNEALAVKLLREPDLLALATLLNPAISVSSLETEAIA
ncbi:MAG: hypothetical protein HYZ62_00550 [Candidatus Andersenbacteria bacterium]|nr:hypothetical protein [Candidatus Andersenbacteria bacterium]